MTGLAALQDTLAGEHAAVWLYGVFGARVSSLEQPELDAAVLAGYAAHRAQRDQLTRAIRDLDTEPIPAAVAYDWPDPLEGPAQLRRAALTVETRCAASYATLVASSVTDQRRWAALALRAAALRSLRLGGLAEPLPGSS